MQFNNHVLKGIISCDKSADDFFYFLDVENISVIDGQFDSVEYDDLI